MEIFGWERPQYYGEPEAHTFRHSNAFDIVGAECRATREQAGIADLTAFSKFEVTGADAEALLDRLTANRMPAKDGGMLLTHFLTTLGGIETEMTITRLAPDRFYLNSAVVGQFHDRDWLAHHVANGEGRGRCRPHRRHGHPGRFRSPVPPETGPPHRCRA